VRPLSQIKTISSSSTCNVSHRIIALEVYFLSKKNTWKKKYTLVSSQSHLIDIIIWKSMCRFIIVNLYFVPHSWKTCFYLAVFFFYLAVLELSARIVHQVLKWFGFMSQCKSWTEDTFCINFYEFFLFIQSWQWLWIVSSVSYKIVNTGIFQSFKNSLNQRVRP